MPNRARGWPVASERCVGAPVAHALRLSRLDLDAARRDPAGELLVIDRAFTREVLALAMRRGDDSFRLLKGKGLSPEAKGDGWLQSIYRQMVKGEWL